MIAPISSPRDAVGVCLLGDKLYAVGGYDGQQYIKDVESYDPIANEWTKVHVLLVYMFFVVFFCFFFNSCNGGVIVQYLMWYLLREYSVSFGVNSFGATFQTTFVVCFLAHLSTKCSW